MPGWRLNARQMTLTPDLACRWSLPPATWRTQAWALTEGQCGLPQAEAGEAEDLCWLRKGLQVHPLWPIPFSPEAHAGGTGSQLRHPLLENVSAQRPAGPCDSAPVFLTNQGTTFTWRDICFYSNQGVQCPCKGRGRILRSGAVAQARVKLPRCMRWGPSSPQGDSGAFFKETIVFIFGYAGLCGWAGFSLVVAGKQGYSPVVGLGLFIRWLLCL